MVSLVIPIVSFFDENMKKSSITIELTYSQPKWKNKTSFSPQSNLVALMALVKLIFEW